MFDGYNLTPLQIISMQSAKHLTRHLSYHRIPLRLFPLLLVHLAPCLFLLLLVELRLLEEKQLNLLPHLLRRQKNRNLPSLLRRLNRNRKFPYLLAWITRSSAYLTKLLTKPLAPSRWLMMFLPSLKLPKSQLRSCPSRRHRFQRTRRSTRFQRLLRQFLQFQHL
ncbi:hypothetical protein F5880DRAFT_1563021 [Lentinula raphanica]|nr:hypothetical protein F5880DRAFT_1563021 [Lentinula raphanica]